MADLLDLSLDAITEQTKVARPARAAKGNGGRGKGKGQGKGKGRGGFAARGGRGGFGGAARQPRAYQARRPTPYGAGIRRTVINDRCDDLGDDWEVEYREDGSDLEDDFEEPPQRTLQTKAARAASGLVTGTTVQVSNLHGDVTEEDMQELFTNPITGTNEVALKSCLVNYDRDGKCNGTCTVVFARKGDAVAALKEYNGIPLDGQAMQLAMVGMPAQERPQRQERPRPVVHQRVVYQPREEQARERPARVAGRGGKGKGKGSGKGRGKGAEPRAAVTEEDLDGGLDDYFAN